MECKFCYTEIYQNEFINCTTCDCKGSISYIHDTCLYEFIEKNYPYISSYNKCKICNGEYKFSRYLCVMLLLFFRNKHKIINPSNAQHFIPMVYDKYKTHKIIATNLFFQCIWLYFRSKSIIFNFLIAFHTNRILILLLNFHIAEIFLYMKVKLLNIIYKSTIEDAQKIDSYFGIIFVFILLLLNYVFWDLVTLNHTHIINLIF